MKFFNWLLTSSVDPQQTSLTVKAALLGVLPIVLHFIGNDIDADAVVEIIGDIVFWALTIVSSLGFLYGAIRKMYYSFVK
jgi:hypothetical protein